MAAKPIRPLQMGEPATLVLGNYTVSVRIMLVTPMDAQQWIARRHPNNRPSSKSVVEKYAEEMSNGEWRPSPEPIVISADGHLINGEHRMRAVVLSGRSGVFVVWEGWPEDAFKVFDRPRIRTIAQGDAISGVDRPKEVYEIARTSLAITTGNNRHPDSAVRVLAAQFHDAWEAVGPRIRSARTARGCTAWATTRWPSN